MLAVIEYQFYLFLNSFGIAIVRNDSIVAVLIKKQVINIMQYKTPYNPIISLKWIEIRKN